MQTPLPAEGLQQAPTGPALHHTTTCPPLPNRPRTQYRYAAWLLALQCTFTLQSTLSDMLNTACASKISGTTNLTAMPSASREFGAFTFRSAISIQPKLPHAMQAVRLACLGVVKGAVSAWHPYPPTTPPTGSARLPFSSWSCWQQPPHQPEQSTPLCRK